MTDTYKRRLAWCLIGSMLFAMPNTSLKAVELNSKFVDTKGHWAEQAIDRMSVYQIIKGYNGLFRPNDPITRGEMSVVIDSIMDYQKSSENIFADVDEAFYKDAILKAYEEELLLDDNGLLYPRSNMTREEVAYMLYHAFEIEKSEEPLTFLDSQEISSWAQEAVASLSSKGMLIGSNGKFRPKDPITRAEVITILNRLLGGYYNTAGNYNGQIEGTVVVSVADANLKDTVISGDLIIAEGVAEGDIILDNVVVEGRTIIKGGGVNSIKVKGKSQLKEVIMAKDDAPVRLVVDESSRVSQVTVDKKATDVIIAGKLEKVVFESAETTLTAQDAMIKALDIVGAAAKIQIKGQTTIDLLSVAKEAEATQITVDKEAEVQTIEAKAKATIEGNGKVSTVKADANDIKIQTQNTQVIVAEGVTGVIASDKPIKDETTTSTTPQDTESNEDEEVEETPEEEAPVEVSTSIVKVETVRNGLVRFELNEALEKALTLDQIHILCTSGGKDMTILDINTSDNRVYELTTSYFDDNTYRLYVYLEEENFVEKDFISKYDCAEISSMEMTRTSGTTATFSYVSDAPGKFYYKLSKEGVVARAAITEEPTAEELIEKGVESTMDLHLNTLQIEGLEEGVAYTLYYVAVDTTNRITPVKSISIPLEVVEEPTQNEITIEEATPYYQPGDLFDENYYFVFKLSEPTKTTLTLDQFEIVCPLDGTLTLGRVETKDNQTYTVYMKKGYVPKERNTFKVTITFENDSVATKGFYVDLTAPIIKSAEVKVVATDKIEVKLDSNEGGKLYYKILDHVEQDISAKDPSDIYKTGTQVDLSYGVNLFEDIVATEGQWFCYATEDQYGNRQFSYGYQQVPKYVASEEPEENQLAIESIEFMPGWQSALKVTFNQSVDVTLYENNVKSISGLSGKLATSISGGGKERIITLMDPTIKLEAGEHTLILEINNQIIKGTFTV